MPRNWVNGRTKLMEKLKTLPELRDIATDQQNQAAMANLVIDRDTASRMGISMSAVDNTLYDAYGQRLVSIMFTQLNQYHVVLEVDPSFRDDPDSLQEHLRAGHDRPSAAQRDRAL